jgi:putative DNA primase/helicase
MPRGRGVRCAGFIGDDPNWARCERPEHAGELRLDERTTPPTYAHKLDGACRCGTEHGARVAAPRARNALPARRIVATYDYQDASGRVLYRVARLDPKGFLPQHINGTGTWEPGYASDERVLYHLPELTAAPGRVVFVCEGERDADHLTSLGLLATTNAGGSASWRKHAGDYCEVFRGRARAVVLVDNDAPGRKWAAEVAESLTAVDCPVVLLELPDLPEAGDVSDWLDAGHTVDELKARVASAPRWTPMDSPVSTAVDTASRKAVSADDFTLTHIGDLLAEPDEATDWLVADLLPMGGLGFVGAKPKAGKSTLCRSLAVAVVRGDDFLGRRCVQGTVVYLALEEKRSEVRRHFRMLGADADDALLIHVAKAPKDALAAMLRLIREHTPTLGSSTRCSASRGSGTRKPMRS